MNSTFLLILLSLTALVGCGEDTGSRRRPLETVTPPITEDDTFVLPSHLHRTTGLSVLTTKQEIDEILATSLPVGYRTIPLMALDDEGTPDKNVRTRTSLGRPMANCGMTAGATVSARITNCSTVNGTTAMWDSSNGAAGESTWRLVTKDGSQEIWADIRTGHLWSDVMDDSTNWCQASGNKTKEDGAAVNCEAAAVDVTCVGKAIMGLTNVKWRLPTRNDFLQADINGLRFVLKISSLTGFWTATMNSKATTRNEAWVYHQEQGTLDSAVLTEDRQVRCIGAATF